MPRNTITPLPQPIFNEGSVSPDPTRFRTAHPSDSQLYKEIQKLLTKDVVSFRPSRLLPDGMVTLRDVWGPHGPEIIKNIQSAGKIVFHAAGDTGASNEGKYANEVRVCDQLSSDCRTADDANRPVFLFQLGDVVYDFGESRYYYDQFYDPFRNYPAPIFAIPGNHDSFIVPNTPANGTPLEIFERNFCATQPVITAEAASLHRTAMTQPGVYFTLDAPFVRIIGLFSNALEDPGVISSEKGKWPAVPDVQLTFLAAQLNLIKKQKYAGAVILAMHHPPFSYAPAKKSGGAGGKNRMVKGRAGQPPREPYFGADVHYLESKPAVTSTGLILKHYDDMNYGYLRITVDKQKLQIGFHLVNVAQLAQSRIDMVTVDLASHTVTGN